MFTVSCCDPVSNGFTDVTCLSFLRWSLVIYTREYRQIKRLRKRNDKRRTEKRITWVLHLLHCGDFCRDLKIWTTCNAQPATGNVQTKLILSAPIVWCFLKYKFCYLWCNINFIQIEVHWHVPILLRHLFLSTIEPITHLLARLRLFAWTDLLMSTWALRSREAGCQKRLNFWSAGTEALYGARWHLLQM